MDADTKRAPPRFLLPTCGPALCGAGAVLFYVKMGKFFPDPRNQPGRLVHLRTDADGSQSITSMSADSDAAWRSIRT